MKPPVLQSRQVSLNEAHEQVHRGNSYVLSHIFPGLASGSAAAWLLFPGITHTHLVLTPGPAGTPRYTCLRTRRSAPAVRR